MDMPESAVEIPRLLSLTSTTEAKNPWRFQLSTRSSSENLLNQAKLGKAHELTSPSETFSCIQTTSLSQAPNLLTD